MPELELNEEYPQSGELWQAEALKELVRKKMALDYASGKVLRDAHPKQHGCVAAGFVVGDDVPSELAAGLFAGPGSYRAWVRFSNQSNVALPYSSKDITLKGFVFPFTNWTFALFVGLLYLIFGWLLQSASKVDPDTTKTLMDDLQQLRSEELVQRVGAHLIEDVPTINPSSAES